MNPPALEDVQRAVGDRYEVLDLAGVGGMGAVFRARHRALGHLVAVKVLPPDVAASQMRQDRFRREASLAAHLSHPNIVPVYEFDTRAGVSFLIMPYVRGTTLESTLEAGRPPTPTILQVLREVGSALDVAHRRGVVHRDVKPANIMIEEDTGRALLTDFGVALIRETPGGALTAPGSIIGTPDYMAPEQIAGLSDVDGRADLYSLGLIAFEALTGTRPSYGADRAALTRTLHGARPEISGALAAALVAPLTDRREDRPASAAAWLALIDQAARRPWPRLAGAALGIVLLAGVLWLVVGQDGSQPANGRSLAVMPFAVLGAAPFPSEQLPQYFLTRFSPVPRLPETLSFRQVRALAGSDPLSVAEADSVAALLGARYFMNASMAFAASGVTLNADLYQTGSSDPVASTAQRGSVDSIEAVMDAAWAEILGGFGGFQPNPYATIPRGKEAIAAFLNGDDAFRRGDYDHARALYDVVIARDPDFAPAYLHRMLAIAQVAPEEDMLAEAMAGARQRRAGLTPADSLLLEGYGVLLERGDGHAALERFRLAAAAAPDAIHPRFVLGEFYLFFGQLFDQSLDSARAAFGEVLTLDPGFAAAIANSISLAYWGQDNAEAQRLIGEYRRIDSTSLVAQVVGLADTLLFQSPKARLAVLASLDRRSFTVLMYLAFQAAQFGTDPDRQGPGRRILAALARRAATDGERILALRFGVAADLREGWVDSALARLATAPPAAAREREMWIVLAQAVGLASLGDAAAARARLAARATAEGDTSATLAWLLALTARVPRGPSPALDRLAAADSAPLAVSLALDLEARRALHRADTATALAHWNVATSRYAVLAVPFGLVASLWPSRRDMVRVAAARQDAPRAIRACRSFDALIGSADQAVWTEMQQHCAPWRGAASTP